MTAKKGIAKLGGLFLLIAGILLTGSCSGEGEIINPPPSADKTALEAKIAEAEPVAVLGTMRIRADGSDVDPANMWVTQAEWHALTESLSGAKTLFSDPAARQTDVDDALAALTGALTNFNPKPGTKVPGVIDPPIADSPAPSFGNNVSVHDPSIFRVNDAGSDDRFRVIGSHLASAKTGDFITWTSIANNGTASDSGRKYYPQDTASPGVQTVAAQRADVLRASPNDGLSFFASDIHRMPNGKFFHYYSLTSTWKSSAIGVAIADTVEGNYITQGLFVRSAEAGENKAPNGTTTWNVNSHPNCIDPQAFFDKDGHNFYMVYGSWSGGIFIYEIDIDTGLPKTNSTMNAESNGYGRKLIANSHSGIEGPYIIYSPESDYYYLFVSFGGLAANGGYNMRVFRSRNPDGPYEDATHPVTPGDPNPLTVRNLTTSTFTGYGVKVMGGYQFAQVSGENSLNSNRGSAGFLSPGHNSAYYDPVAGKYFLIHHTRFVNEGERHHVRVREMFVNEDGWLVAAPFRYDGGTVRAFTTTQLSRDWKILSHGRDNNTTISGHTSQNYFFNENGTITGAGTGTWTLGSDKKTARIYLNGKLYKGVFLRCYDEYHSVWVYAFTAMSSDGIALWGATRGVPQT